MQAHPGASVRERNEKLMKRILDVTCPVQECPSGSSFFVNSACVVCCLTDRHVLQTQEIYVTSLRERLKSESREKGVQAENKKLMSSTISRSRTCLKS